MYIVYIVLLGTKQLYVRFLDVNLQYIFNDGSGNRTRKSGGRAVIRLVNKKEKEGFSGAGAIVGGICGIIVLGVAGFVSYKL